MDANGGPIHSKFEDDPGRAGAIEAFVIGLAERVDALQDNELSGDWPRMIAGLTDLARVAEAAGYPDLVQSAGEVMRAAHERHGELAHKELVLLTEVASRIRRGHRGAL